MARYIGYGKFDTANGPGVRTSVFLSGCSFRCEGCWSLTATNPRVGTPFTQDTVNEVLADCSHEAVSGLSVLGGEPFENLDATLPLVRAFRDRFGSRKTIWVWSGYTWENLVSDPEKREVLPYLDVVVDGQFVLALRDTSLRFRGSSNQVVVDVPCSLRAGEVVWWQGIRPGE